jgi:hypothetical protein
MTFASRTLIMETSRPKHTSPTFIVIRKLIAEGTVKISAHGYDELSASGLCVDDVIRNFEDSLLIEDYPLFPKGPCVLILNRDQNGHAVHMVCGIPKSHPGPAVLITAYRPDDTRWDEGFTRRKR